MLSSVPSILKETPDTCGTVLAVSSGPSELPENMLIGLLGLMLLLLFIVLLQLRRMRHRLERESAARMADEQQLRELHDNLPNITLFQLIFSTPDTFRFTRISQGLEQSLGIPRDQVMADARTLFDQVYEADVPILQKSIHDIQTSLEPSNMEIRILDRNGKPHWIRISTIPRRENGVLICDGFMQDFSEQKDVRTAIQEENRNFQNLFQTIDDFLIICDMDGQLIHTNPSVEGRLQYSHTELENMSVFELYPKQVRKEIFRVIALMQSEPSTTSSHPLQMRDGATIPVEMNFFQGIWKNQKSIFGVARDISRRQRVEDALRESQRMLQLIIDTIPMPIFWKDKDSIYLGCNKAFIQECGMQETSDVVGKTPYDLFDPDIIENVVERDQKVIETNQPVLNHSESTLLPDGSTGWREISNVPLRDINGNAVGVLGVWRDVTEQNRAEERLKRTLEDMERFNQLMRGRERRTLELKSEINALLRQLGKPGKYRTTMDDLS